MPSWQPRMTSSSVSWRASSGVFPMANSVARLEVEMAPGQPWVRNLKIGYPSVVHHEIDSDEISAGGILTTAMASGSSFLPRFGMGEMIDQGCRYKRDSPNISSNSFSLRRSWFIFFEWTHGSSSLFNKILKFRDVIWMSRQQGDSL